jgi:hypothetical protein
VFASDNGITIKVNLELEKNGVLPNCDLLSVGSIEKSIDCHDLFFSDEPFMDTHTISFNNLSRQIGDRIDTCLYRTTDGKHEILKCKSMENIGDDRIRELTFHFTETGIRVENPSLTRSNKSDSFSLGLNLIGERQLLCPKFDFYINHPQLYNNLSSINCSDLSINDPTPTDESLILEKRIPSGTFKDSEVFEACLAYTTGRICELGENPIDHSQELITLNLTEIQ